MTPLPTPSYDINHDWQNLKQVILEAAREFELSKDAKNANHW